MATQLEKIFNEKYTENGDLSYKSTLNPLVDILFMTEFFQKHLDTVSIGTSDKEKLFSMFIRDPRYGLGKRDLGRQLMKLSNCSIEQIIKAGRYDDVLEIFGLAKEVLDYLKKEIENGNELAKKWMPRYSSKNLLMARAIANYWGMNKQQYGHFIKSNTVEQSLSRKTTEGINFEHVPSLAMIKYYHRFSNKPDTAERFAAYLEDVKNNKKKIKVATTTVYDIYKNATKIDPDMFFDKIEKISGSWLPILDTSGSMWDENDSMGKAASIGHYLSKCSSYAPNQLIAFSSEPTLLTIGKDNYNLHWANSRYSQLYRNGERYLISSNLQSKYVQEINSLYTGDCSNTDLGAVMLKLEELDDLPEYLVVLSDMEFDSGSKMSKDELRSLWKSKGYKTKIVWWSFNSRSTTAPEISEDGNIFLSGYSPMLLKFLEVGFDGEKFLNKLLEEYKARIDS